MAVTRSQIEALLTIIKREYLLGDSRPVPKEIIYHFGSAELNLNKSDIDWIIRVHIENGVIVEDVLLKGHYKPFLKTEDYDMVAEIQRKLNLKNIETCIDIFYEKNKMREEYDRYPDLLQLEEIFVEKFGRIESEKFKDFVRDFVKKGRLNRTPALTYMKKEVIEPKKEPEITKPKITEFMSQ